MFEPHYPAFHFPGLLKLLSRETTGVTYLPPVSFNKPNLTSIEELGAQREVMCAGIVNSKLSIKYVYWNKIGLWTLCLRRTKFLVLELLVPWKWHTLGLLLLDHRPLWGFYKALLTPFRFLFWHLWGTEDLFCQPINSFKICAFPLKNSND